MSIETFRQQAPEFNDLDDKEFFDAVYNKYYPSVDRATFDQAIQESLQAQEPESIVDRAINEAENNPDFIDQIEGFGKGIVEGAVNFGEAAALGLITPTGEETESSVRKGILDTTDYLKSFVSPDVGEEDLAGRKVGQAFGSFIPPAAVALAPYVGLPIAATTTVAAQVGEASERAREEEATEAERGTAAVAGILPGVIDILPIKKIKELREVIGDSGVKNLATRAKRVAEVGGIEAATEVATSAIQNLIQKGVYDPSKEIVGGKELSQYAEEGSLGFIVGGVVQGILDLALPSKRGTKTDITKEKEDASKPEDTDTVTPEDDVADTTPLVAEDDFVLQEGAFQGGVDISKYFRDEYSYPVEAYVVRTNEILKKINDANERLKNKDITPRAEKVNKTILQTQKKRLEELAGEGRPEGISDFGYNDNSQRINDAINLANNVLGITPVQAGSSFDEKEDEKISSITEEKLSEDISKDRKNSRQKAKSKTKKIIKDKKPESVIGSYTESNSKVQEDLTDQQESNKPPNSYETKSFVLGTEDGKVNYGKTKSILYQVADRLIGLKDIEAKINLNRQEQGLKPITTLESAYDREESIPGKAGNLMREFEENRLKPLAKDIAEANTSLEEVDNFLILRHAIERNNRLQKRSEKIDPEVNPASGEITIDDKKQLLTNSFVKKQMKEKYDIDWDDVSGTWKGGNEKAQKLFDIAKKTDQIVNETRETMINTGLISRDAGDSIGAIYKYYTPLKGKAQIDDIDEVDFGTTGKSYSVKGTEIYAAGGRGSQASSPIGNIVKDAQNAFKRGLNNKEFGQTLVNLIENNPDKDFWEVYSPRGRKYEKQFSRKFKYIGEDKKYIQKDEKNQDIPYETIPEGANKKEFLETIEYLPPKDFTTADGRDLIGVKIDGKQYFVDIKQDEKLRKALLADPEGQMNALLRPFGMINRYLSFVNTSLNPEFVLGNFTRDIQTAVYNLLAEQEMTKGKAKDQELIKEVLMQTIPSVGRFYKAVRRYDPKDGTFKGNMLGLSQKDLNNFKDFVESGARADWFYVKPVAEQIDNMNTLVDMAKGNFKGNFKKGYKAVFDFVEDANSSVENGVRLATFVASRDALLERGIAPDLAKAQAATLAKNLTINFNRKGMMGDMLNSTYLFFNASMQGTMNLVRGMNPLDKDSSRIKQGVIGGLAGFGALMAWLGEEESEIDPMSGRSYYSQIPDYIKERNIVKMLPMDTNPKDSENINNTYIREGKEVKDGQPYFLIPLPYGYNVFYLLGNVMAEMSRGTKSAAQATSMWLSSLAGSFSPIGQPNSAIAFAPTAFKPALEIIANEDYFGAPVFKDPMAFGQYGPYSTTHFKNTNPYLSQTTEFLNNLSQRVADPSELPTKYERSELDKTFGSLMSPDTIEHLIEFALGGAGKFVLRTESSLRNKLENKELDPNRFPFVRKFYGETNSSDLQAEYYDRIDKLKEKKVALNELPRQKRARWRKENYEYVRMLRRVDRFESKIKDIREKRNKAIKEAEENPMKALSLPKKEELYDRQEDIQYKKFNRLYDRIVGRLE